MTQITDRPTVAPPRPVPEKREGEGAPIRQAPVTHKRPTMFRWLGWLLVVAAVAAATTVIVLNVTSEEATPAPAEVVLPSSAVTADPKPQTPVWSAELLSDGTTTWPGIYWAPRAVQQPETTFPEESTVYPGS